MSRRSIAIASLLGGAGDFQVRREVAVVAGQRVTTAVDGRGQRCLDILEGLLGGSFDGRVVGGPQPVEGTARFGDLARFITEEGILQLGVGIGRRPLDNVAEHLAPLLRFAHLQQRVSEFLADRDAGFPGRDGPPERRRRFVVILAFQGGVTLIGRAVGPTLTGEDADQQKPHIQVVSRSCQYSQPPRGTARMECGATLKFMAFRGVDYINFDSSLSEQELLVRQTARRFVDDQVLPLIRDCWREGTFPSQLIRPMGELGFLGANLDGYGCAGMSNVEYGLIMQELERADSGVRSFVSVQGALVMYPILTYGSEEQKERWLPRLQSGEAIGCFGLTEPNFGSNPAGMTTRARREGDGWILNGEKTWITNGSVADISIVWARTDDGVRGFLIERGTPGFQASDLHGKLSMRASVTSSLSLSDCHLPSSAMLPGAKGLKAPLSCLTQARYGIGWGVIGAAMDCFETARSYSVLRKQFDDKPIASHQLVQEKLAEVITEITKAQLLALHCGRLKDQGKLTPAHVSMLKRNNVAMALESARLCRDLLGANGIMDEYPIMRHLCNLETVKTYEGTDHIHALVIGEAVTGSAAYR